MSYGPAADAGMAGFAADLWLDDGDYDWDANQEPFHGAGSVDAMLQSDGHRSLMAEGVAVSALEMSQNFQMLRWSRREVDERLRKIMRNIHRTCYDTAEEFGAPGNLVCGANIAGFLKVANAMLDQGVV